MSMAWVAVGTAVVGAAASAHSSKKADKAARHGAYLQKEGQEGALGFQREVFDYDREAQRLPMGFRDAAMRSMGGEYGLTVDEEGNVLSDGTTIQQRAMASPLYTGALQAGEDAIGRSASATGRLRGGATPSALGKNAQNAYMQSYLNQLQGLSGFARTPYQAVSGQPIANTMSNIGQTQALGAMGSAQAQQQGYRGIMDSIGAGANIYGNYAGNFGGGGTV